MTVRRLNARQVTLSNGNCDTNLETHAIM